MSGPLSLSGVELDGESLVRLIYVDESGTSTRNPVLVVAGVFIDADRQWKAVEAHVSEIIDDYVKATRGPIGLPDWARHSFVLHSTDMYHGSDDFDRGTYPIEQAHTALKRLLAVPATFKLPVVYGYMRKLHTNFDHIAKSKDRSRSITNEIANDHAVTFTMCAAAAERYMRGTKVDQSEIAKITAENHEKNRRHVKIMHDLMRGQLLDANELKSWSDDLKLNLPLKKIVDAVSFEEKTDAFLLQVADAAA